MKYKGNITNKAQELANKLLSRNIDSEDVQLFSYLDFCWKKSDGCISVDKLSFLEVGIMEDLQYAKLIELNVYNKNMYVCKPTKKFYTFVQNILAECYVSFKGN